MRMRTTIKKTISCLMALMFAVLSCNVPGAMVYAAEEYYIRFYDDANNKESENQRIVEGTSINIRANLPEGYKISTATPFAVKKQGETADASGNFSITSSTPKLYNITAKAGSAGKGSQDYTLEAIYTAVVTGGNGLGTFDGKKDDGTDISNRYALNVLATPGIAIIEDSSITFKASANEDVEAKLVAFDSVTEASGGFTDYKTSAVISTPFKTDSGGRYTELTIASSGADTPKSLKLKVYIDGSAQILKGTTFKIDFRRQTINSLIATVVSEKTVVTDTATGIKQSSTLPEANEDNIPYITLGKNETLESIRTNFAVRTKVHKDNVDILIDWAWDAKNDDYQSFVKLNKGGLNSSVFDIQQRPLEDMVGELTAKISYNTTEESIVIPIIIYGTGQPVEVTPTTQWTGVPGTVPTEKVETITAFPKTMDVYKGRADFAAYPNKPDGPFSFSVGVTYGSGRGRASKMVIEHTSQGGELEAMVDGDVVPYAYGSDLEDPSATRSIRFTATKKGQVQLAFKFYNAANELMKDFTVIKQININDSSPRTDATLKALDVKLVNDKNENQDLINSVYPSGVFPYTFDPATNEYSMTVPYKAEKVSLRSVLPPATGANKSVKLKYANVEQEVDAGTYSPDIALTSQVPLPISITVTAEDGSINVYTLNITRDEMSKESRLESLQAYRTDMESPLDLIQGFSPDKKEYTIEVPYRADKLELKLKPMSPWVESITFDPAEQTTGFWIWTKKVLKFPLKCEFDPETGAIINNTNIIKIKVTAEDGIGVSEYTLTVKRLPPSTDNTIKSIVITDKLNAVIPFDEGQVYDPLVRDYYVSIPYSMLLVNINATQNHDEAANLSLTAPLTYGGKVTNALPKRGEATIFRNVDVSQNISTPDITKNNFVYAVRATAESGTVTEPPYNIHFIRKDPDADTRLKSMDIMDGEGKALDSYAFNMEQLSYDIKVPYEVTRVTITPKAQSPLASVDIDAVKLSDNRPGVSMELTAGTAKTVVVTVTAESAETRSYIVTLTRGLPSGEARLSDLSVGALILKPKFNPNTLIYDVLIPEGTKGYAVTASTVSPFATFTINGKAAVSGTASETIVPADAKSQAVIEVTAQDGRTKIRYAVNISDDNLIVKSDNADLNDIKVYEGAVSPRFKAGILDYEISLKNDARSLDILPKPADENAKIEVSQGSLKLENYNDMFSTAILEDSTEFKVKVTASDGKAVKTYNMTAYRNNEEKAGVYKPITADMIDFEGEQNPIYVDISKYTVVNADVFNTLMKEYPDKTLVFEGNDYSLQINGKDMSTLVPNTDQFDFSMTFNGPNNAKIIELIHSLDARNANLSPVILHFGHHGSLPAPMMLTVSLGGFYKNKRLYWNYYNEERNRIDYYGYVGTNAQGTFSVPMTHMSDFPITDGKAFGSENKTGMLGTASENLGNANTSGKRNPQTGIANAEEQMINCKCRTFPHK